MFRGSSFHTIDPKGRVIIPAKFRELVRARLDSEGIMVSKLDTCLVAYPLAEWGQGGIKNSGPGRAKRRDAPLSADVHRIGQ